LAQAVLAIAASISASDVARAWSWNLPVAIASLQRALDDAVCLLAGFELYHRNGCSLGYVSAGSDRRRSGVWDLHEAVVCLGRGLQHEQDGNSVLTKGRMRVRGRGRDRQIGCEEGSSIVCSSDIAAVVESAPLSRRGRGRGRGSLSAQRSGDDVSELACGSNVYEVPKGQSRDLPVQSSEARCATAIGGVETPAQKFHSNPESVSHCETKSEVELNVHGHRVSATSVGRDCNPISCGVGGDLDRAVLMRGRGRSRRGGGRGDDNLTVSVGTRCTVDMYTHLSGEPIPMCEANDGRTKKLVCRSGCEKPCSADREGSLAERCRSVGYIAMDLPLDSSLVSCEGNLSHNDARNFQEATPSMGRNGDRCLHDKSGPRATCTRGRRRGRGSKFANSDAGIISCSSDVPGAVRAADSLGLSCGPELVVGTASSAGRSSRARGRGRSRAYSDTDDTVVYPSAGSSHAHDGSEQPDLGNALHGFGAGCPGFPTGEETSNLEGTADASLSDSPNGTARPETQFKDRGDFSSNLEGEVDFDSFGHDVSLSRGQGFGRSTVTASGRSRGRGSCRGGGTIIDNTTHARSMQGADDQRIVDPTHKMNEVNAYGKICDWGIGHFQRLEPDSDDDGGVIEFVESERGETPSDELPDDDPRAYKVGGYHSVAVSELFAGKFQALSKLGAGAFSTVWLCIDVRGRGSAPGRCRGRGRGAITQARGGGAEFEPARGTSELVALKVCKSKESITKQALDEAAVMDELQQGHTPPSQHVVRMLDHFSHDGPHGRHTCLAFEVMGENLLELVRYYVPRAGRDRGEGGATSGGGVPLPMTRRIARHALLGLEYIHRRGIVHTDIKLENVLIQRHDFGDFLLEARRSLLDIERGSGSLAPPTQQRERLASLRVEDVHAKLADFGNAQRLKKKVTDDIQTQQYRSPEVIIGQVWDETADIWSVACTCFEIVTGEYLFDPKDGEAWPVEEDHLAQVVELLGEYPPREWALSGRLSKDFFAGGGRLKHLKDKSLKFWPLPRVLAEKHGVPPNKAGEIAELLLLMLRWEPQQRASAAEALCHGWVRVAVGEAT